MTDGERMHEVQTHAASTEEQIEGRAEGTVGSMTGDREQRTEGLADEVKGKLLEMKARLQNSYDGHDSDPDPHSRH